MLVPAFVMAEEADTPDSLSVQAGAPAESAGLTRSFRISAIAGSDDAYFVGMVDESTGDSRLLRIGDVFFGYRIDDIRPDEQEVIISRDGQRYVMYLQGDSTMVAALPPEGSLPAEAAAETGDDYSPPPEARTLEDFLRENYEAAGMKSPDDPIPEEYLKPVTPEEALRRMAESVGMPVPEDALKPVTREEFLKLHGSGEALKPAE